MLTTPSHILILCMFANGFQDFLLHYCRRYWGKAEQPVVPQVFFLAPPADRRDICFLPVFRNLCSSEWPFKDNQEWLWRDISQLPPPSYMHPFRSTSPLCAYDSFLLKGMSLLLQTVSCFKGLEFLKTTPATTDQSKGIEYMPQPFPSPLSSSAGGPHFVYSSFCYRCPSRIPSCCPS